MSTLDIENKNETFNISEPRVSRTGPFFLFLTGPTTNSWTEKTKRKTQDGKRTTNNVPSLTFLHCFTIYRKNKKDKSCRSRQTKTVTKNSITQIVRTCIERHYGTMARHVLRTCACELVDEPKFGELLNYAPGTSSKLPRQSLPTPKLRRLTRALSILRIRHRVAC